jgi:hypothetical protein
MARPRIVRRIVLLLASHAIVLAVGFALGIYLLPILTAPDAPSGADVAAAAKDATYRAAFRHDLRGSDALHWGEGDLTVGPGAVAFAGRLAPGPAYRLYLTPRFVETKDEFVAVKPASIAIGDVKTFENFVVAVPAGVDIARYDSVVVWCEAFSMFITSAKYR